ncbi:uncharacterized protein (DUF1501 family) [Inhella inkyongensis]|uniref:Uncharacterized protein (DUF1501 family) n=1 Tax=Inhella inkyongensis TaxID=392593 RepID=A0A840S115_9BURK|nr:DUF1501 domain-containing protein [Inhella inkyongensis]MBB5204797.1 uncharacterized protein (DUF1501 family) [Inhella inkyongensis]
MKTPHTTRRALLRAACALTAAPALSAQAQSTEDYKALVCVFMAGGCDGHNLLVPQEATAYAEYRRLRGALALPDGSATLLPIRTPQGQAFALNSGLQAIHPLWAQGRLAAIANMGPLLAPTTRAQMLAGTATLPAQLFSHPDQAQLTQAGNGSGGGTGWGGRCADAVLSRNGSARFPAAVSMSGAALFTNGVQVPAASLIPGFNLEPDGMNTWPATASAARSQALNEILALDGGARLVQAANQVRRDALSLGALLRSGGSGTINTVFPGTDLGRQLQQVARVMALRQSVGMRRQVFFVQIGGFDTHGAQSWQHWDLLRQVGEALAAFYAATQELGLAQSVTTFTQSEFGRSLQPSGSGSDHGWGNHHLVLGGAVRGGQVYGRFPFPALGGPDDSGSRGALIPSTSLEQFGATLARWFGADAQGLANAFPNLPAFAPQDLGFMGG